VGALSAEVDEGAGIDSLVNTLLMPSQEMCARSDEAALGAITASASRHDEVDSAGEDSVTVSLFARRLLRLPAGQGRVRLAFHEECRRIAALIDAVTAQPGVGTP